MEFTSLDKESTMTQMIPYLKSLKSKAECEDYLKSLIGKGKKQDDFVSRYCDQTFRNHPPVTKNLNDKSAFPSLQSTQRTSSSAAPTPSPRDNFPIRNRAAKSKQPPKLKTESSGESRQTVDPTVYQNFGNAANVYIKARESQESTDKSWKKKKSTPNISGSVTPEFKPEPIQDVGPSKVNDKIPSSDSKSKTSIDVDIPISELSPSSLKELLQLKIILESFESEKSSPKGAGTCFCEARSHGLPIGRLPKQCHNCGLIYCRLKPALSPCPSCGEVTGLSRDTNLRDNLRSEFIAKRDSLIKLEVEKYQRRLSLEEQKEALAREAERAYPSLPSKSPSADSKINRPQSSTNSSYSNQLGGGVSIQDQIKLGYARLAKQFEENSKDRTSQGRSPNASSESHTSHKVLRINPKNGKTKIITVTKKKPEGHDPKQTQLHELLDRNFMLDDDDVDNPSYGDEADDLVRIASGLRPSLFIENPPEPIVPDYVAMGVYHV